MLKPLSIFTLVVFSTFSIIKASAGEPLPNHDIVVFDLNKTDSGYSVTNPQVIASSPGYDNQPKFSRDGELIYYTHIENDRADIWQWSFKARSAKQKFTSERSEYSPTPIPFKPGYFSHIRVEVDGTQRLWQVNEDNEFSMVFDEIKPVGYHAWSGKNIGMFILGDEKTPQTLLVTEYASEQLQVVDENIGRCLQKYPGKDAISYTQHDGGKITLRYYDFIRKQSTSLFELPHEVQDYAWIDETNLLTSDGKQLVVRGLGKSSKWQSVENSTKFKLNGITRLAVSPNKDKVAVVFTRIK